MPTYKGIEMPTNNADKIGAMIESAKNKLMGTPVGDFVRGVGAVGTIPNTIVAGTQNSYGANIPTVEGLKQNLTASVEQGNIASDVGTGVSRIFNNVNTPTLGATVNQPLLNMAKESATTPIGVPESSSDGYTPGPFGANPAEGGRLTSFNLNDKEMEEWKERGRLMEGLGATEKNPNDRLFREAKDEYLKLAGESTSENMGKNIAKLNALGATLKALAPQTSFGAYGIAKGNNETTQRGQDIDKELNLFGANAEESRAKSKLYGTQAKILEEQGKPDKIREREVSGWLTERRKVINAALEGIADMSPEDKEKRMATLKADFNKHNPAPPRKAKQNADGTVTVEYADGRVVTGKPKK
jgi:hypothetical protein